jgi:UPF0755 protein
MEIKKAIKKINPVNVIAAIEVLLVFIIFILFYLTREVNVKRIVYVPKGNTNYTIKYLQHEGYDISKIDKIFIRIFGYPQAGWIDLKEERMSKLDFLYRLTKSKAALTKVIIIPGETNYFIYKQISKKLKIPKMYCNIDEGFIKPDTYYLPIGMKREDVCSLLKEVSLKWHQDIAKKVFGVWNYKKYKRYLIIASIIQKEAANKDEMKYVSAVIYNRLKKSMPLQMDGSLNYGKYSHTPITPKRLRTDKSRYNTYLYKGLPPEPVCVVSKDAILAAIFPAKVKFLYFYKCGKRHLFSTNYAQHVNNIRRCKK